MKFEQDKLVKAFRYKRLVSEPIKTVDLSVKINVSRATMHRMEKGKDIDMKTFVKVCEYLEIQPSVFFSNP